MVLTSQRVVQEVVLGGQTRCYLGSHSILLRAIIDVALHVRMSAKWTDTTLEITDKFSADTAIAIENLVTLRKLKEDFGKGIPQDPDIAELIQQGRQWSDPRDMVYSILGLWDPAVTKELPPRLRVRLHDSVPNVYRSTTRYSLAHRDGPYILHQVAHRSDGDLMLDGFPSWVPRWDLGTLDGKPHRLSNEFHAWKPWNALVKPKDKCEDKEKDVLRMDGVLVDTVHKITDPLRSTDVRDPAKLLRFIRQAEEIAGSDVDAVAETLIAGCANFFKIATHDDIVPFNTFREHLARLAGHQSPTVEGEENTTTSQPQLLPQALPQGKRRKRYHRQLMTACLWRRFFITQNGHVGLGPRATKEGDVVVVLRNGPWPFVLRPLDDGQDERKYQLLGQAYVRGWMQGEVVREVEEGKKRVGVFCMV